METPDLTSSEYWEGVGIDIRLNPHRAYDIAGLEAVVREEMGIESAVVLATSGSEGEPKFVVLRKSALLASARAVNDHCGLTISDTWLGGLSTFHVGGLGIYARAYLSGAAVIPMRWDQWEQDGSRLVEMCLANWIRVTSLTPVHLYDLVAHQVRCPESLRGVFIGGGALMPSTALRAMALGWPVWTTYGMTETCSQVATSAAEEFDWLPILGEWEAKITDDDRLAVRGKGLFSGYVTRDENGTWKVTKPFDEEGWFTTGDQCRIKGEVIRFLGRADDLVKVSGELISVSRLERELAQELDPTTGKGVVIAMPHARRENELIAFVEGGAKAEEAARNFSNSLIPLEQFAKVVLLDKLPRTDLGKIDRAGLRAWEG